MVSTPGTPVPPPPTLSYQDAPLAGWHCGRAALTLLDPVDPEVVLGHVQSHLLILAPQVRPLAQRAHRVARGGPRSAPDARPVRGSGGESGGAAHGVQVPAGVRSGAAGLRGRAEEGREGGVGRLRHRHQHRAGPRCRAPGTADTTGTLNGPSLLRSLLHCLNGYTPVFATGL